MRKGFNRNDRVGDLIQKALARILLEDGDKRFQFVTVTSVAVSRDLSYAKVYVTVLLEEEAQINEVIRALNQNAKAYRYELAHAVKLRIVPELKFVFDSSTAEGFRISSLIDSALKKSGK